jgi:hypothetical protein
VRQAVRAFADNWLADWKVRETSDSVEATGEIAGHLVTAKFGTEPTQTGTKLTVVLRVLQAGSAGSTPATSGEDYDGQIRKWLEALPWWVQQKQAAAIDSAGHRENGTSSGPRIHRRLRIGDIVGYAFLITWFLVITLFALLALIGLISGELKLPSKRSGNLVTILGWGARIVSVFILAVYGWIVSSIWKWRKGHKGKPWV